MAARAYCAGWDLTAPGDPNRSWSVTLSTAGSYDDNFNATEKNRQQALRLLSDLKFRANVPLDRLFMGAQYDYTVDYPRDLKLGGYDESHNLNLSANYTFNPRLTLGLNEIFINSLEPQLVQGPANAPISIVHNGTYIYDTVSGTLNYLLTPRWSLSAGGSWDIWRYEDQAAAIANDREDYSASLSALYAVDTRTTVGVNYQYSEVTYVDPGLDNGLNAYANTAYLSLVRRFNPRLSGTLNGGYTVRRSENGSTATSPSAFGSLVYNYGLDNTISLTLAQSLSDATTSVNRQFSSQENTTSAIQINHRFTVRLRAQAVATYTYSSFNQPLSPTKTVKPNDQAITAHLGLNYAFRDWLSATLDYYRYDLTSSDSTLVPPYTRDQVNFGITLTY